MATDLATLAIRVENGDVIKTTTALNSMEVAGTKAEASTTRLTRRMALLEIQAREMDAQMAKNATALGRLKGAMESVERAAPGLADAFKLLSVAAAVGFIGHKTLEETEQAQAAMAQLEAAVKSTGGAAGRTVQQLDELSLALQKQTTYSDEAVKGAESILLTFDKIKGDTFDRATRAVTDLAARLGRDLPDAALQVGKALQDPVQGMNALQRLGIRLSASQKQTIQDFVDTGRSAEAMGVILSELERKFGGSAAAARDTLGGAIAGLKNAFGDLFEVSHNASQGTVDGINAITKSLEESGLSMNAFVHNTVVGWAKIKDAAIEANEILSLQVGAGFFERAKAIAQRHQVDLSSTLAALNAPAKIAPVGGAGGSGTDVSEAAQKFDALVQAREEELGKLTALNAAYRENSEALKILGFEYDAQIQKSHDAEGHTARQRALLDGLTDATTKQKIAQIQLNAELEREARLQASRDANTATLEAALHARDRAGLSAPDAEIQAILDAATEAMAAAQRVHDQKQRLSAADQIAADRELTEAKRTANAKADFEIEAIQRARQAATDTSIGLSVRDAEQQTAGIRAMIAAELEGGKAVEQMRVQLAGQDAVTRALNDATANNTTVTDEQAASLRRTAEEYERVSIAAEKLRAISQEVGTAVNQAITDVFNRKNPAIALGQQIKAEIIAALSQPITAKITAVIAKVTGIDAPVSKQEQAARLMNQAADKMLHAAEGMNGAASDTGNGSVADASTVFNPQQTAVAKYAQQFLKIGGSAYGGYQAGYGIGASTQSQTQGAIGGAVSGAVTGAAVAGVPGAIVGGFAGFVGGLVGAADAAREAERALLAMGVEAHKAAENFHTSLFGDSLDQTKAELKQQYVGVIKQLLDANGGKYPPGFARTAVPRGNLADDFTQAAEDYTKAVQRATEQYQRSLQEESADYHARFLRATGHTAEADAEEFANKQRRERQQLVDSFGDYIDAQEQATLSSYDQAAAAEKAAYAMGTLTTALHNAPSGFKLAGYVQQYAEGSPYPGQRQAPSGPFLPPTLPLTPPMLPPTGLTPPGAPQWSQLSRSSTSTVATAPVTITIAPGAIQITAAPNQDERKLAKAVVKEFDRYASTLGGLNSTRTDGMEAYS